MKEVFVPVGILYFLLVLNFYYQSNGFRDHYTYSYAFWKITPIAFLSAFSFIHGGKLDSNDKVTAALGLVFGGLGDWIIGVQKNGIILGAIAFGVGHLFYLSILIKHQTQVHNRLVIAILVWGAIIGQLCLLPLFPGNEFPVTILAIYSLILSGVTVISISQFLNGSKTQNKEGLYFRAIGFALFFVSDSVLIMSHTGLWKLFSELIVLGTYYSAQFLILYGNNLAATPLKI